MSCESFFSQCQWIVWVRFTKCVWYGRYLCSQSDGSKWQTGRNQYQTGGSDMERVCMASSPYAFVGVPVLRRMRQTCFEHHKNNVYWRNCRSCGILILHNTVNVTEKRYRAHLLYIKPLNNDLLYVFYDSRQHRITGKLYPILETYRLRNLFLL